MQSDRQLIDKLVNEQKFEAAAKEAARIRGEARRRGDEKTWTWALIKEVQLRTALHGYETAVRFLKEEPWPKDPILRDMLELFFAQSLVTYHTAYSWEINRRERVEAKGPVDLKAWTKDQIYQEAWSSLMRVWDDRDRLADLQSQGFSGLLEPGRLSRRDPRHAEGRRHLPDGLAPRGHGFLDAPAVQRDLPPGPRRVPGTAGERKNGRRLSSTTPPLILSNGFALSSANTRPGAGSPAGPKRPWKRAWSVFAPLMSPSPQEDDRARIRKSLADSLGRFRSYPWWAWGQALLAEFTREGNSPDALVQARKLALEGNEAYPDSPGGQRCLHIVKSIESPDFSVEAMRTDAPGRRSVRATHRNLDAPLLPGLPGRLDGADPDIQGLQPVPRLA